MRNLWVAGNALNVEGLGNDDRVRAGMIAFDVYELILIDGAKCEGRTAPDNRAHSLLSRNPATFAFLKVRPPSEKSSRLRSRSRSRPLRSEEMTICFAGGNDNGAGEGNTEGGSEHVGTLRQDSIGLAWTRLATEVRGA